MQKPQQHEYAAAENEKEPGNVHGAARYGLAIPVAADKSVACAFQIVTHASQLQLIGGRVRARVVDGSTRKSELISKEWNYFATLNGIALRLAEKRHHTGVALTIVRNDHVRLFRYARRHRAV